MKKRITVASAVVAAAAAVTSALLARRARFFAQAPQRNEAAPVPLLDVGHPAGAADGRYADAAGGRNAARGLRRLGPRELDDEDVA